MQHQWVRPSSSCYRTFSLAMVSSPGFGSTTTDYIALVRLGFPAPPLKRLSSPVIVSRWPIMQKVRGHTPKGCYHCLYACDFRSISLPIPGFFSPFAHTTSSLSVSYEYLALEDGPPIFRQDFSCPALLFARPPDSHSHTGLSPPMADLSRVILLGAPIWCGTGLFPFRSPLLWESRLISFPPVT